MKVFTFGSVILTVIYMVSFFPTLPDLPGESDSLPFAESDSLETGRHAKAPCPCPEISDDWAAAPDSMDVPFILCSLKPIPIRRMIMCEHGVFLCFVAEEGGSYHPWWFAFVMPTKERYRPYTRDGDVGEDVVLFTKLEANVIKDRDAYFKLREGLKEIFGERYQEGKIIRFDRTYEKAPTLKLADVIEVAWKGNAKKCRLIPEVYFRKKDFEDYK